VGAAGSRRQEGGRAVTQGPGERDLEAVSRFRERFASVLLEAGFPPMPARVFTALLVTDSGRLTAAELSALLSASPAAISGAVRYLEQLGLISRQREPGTRRDVYLVLDEIWYEVSMRRDQVLQRWVNAARDGILVLGPGTPAARRMADSLDFFAFLAKEVPALMERWREHRSGG
jgi:predicted transcriptional regulator